MKVEKEKLNFIYENNYLAKLTGITIRTRLLIKQAQIRCFITGL